MNEDFRFYFTPSKVIGRGNGKSAYQTVPVPTKTDIIIKAKNIKEADRKARDIIRKAELFGIYQIEKDRG